MSDTSLMFSVGDKAVYPGHGVGVVTNIETKEVSGSELLFYALTIEDSGMKVLVPEVSAAKLGLRPLMSEDDVGQVIKILKMPKACTSSSKPWHRRKRQYLDQIKTGSVYAIAEILSELQTRQKEKPLSFGEKKVFEQARDLLWKELSLFRDSEKFEINQDIIAIFGLDPDAL